MRTTVSQALTGLAVLLLAASVHADDAGDPLAELANLGAAVSDSGPEGGGSIRAKKDVDPAVAKRMNDPKNLEAKVEEVKGGKFPLVAVRLSVLKPAKDGAGKDVAKNAALSIVPKLKVASGAVDMQDEATRINAGAFYLKAGDKVVVRLGDKKDKFYEAEYIERK